MTKKELININKNSDLYNIITGNQGVFVPRQSTIGVMFVNLPILQNEFGIQSKINIIIY